LKFVTEKPKVASMREHTMRSERKKICPWG